MNKDIVPELLERIETEFKNKTEKSKILKKKILALKSGKATHLDSNEFAIEVGNILADVFKNEITEDALPDKKMYYNIAKRLIEPNMKTNYDLVSDYSREVQEVLNEESNISLKAIKPEINQDRIDGIVNKISGYDDFKEGKWLLYEPIINFTQSVVDDTIRTNADFQFKSGLTPKVVRKEAGNCCDWCKEVAGTYNYPDEVPNDVWRRHRYCRCTVEYFPGDGRKQDSWTKKWGDADKSDKIEKRKKFNKQGPRLILKDSQFGKKAKAHMADFGLDVKKPSDRILFERIIRDIVDNSEETIRGIEWRGQKDLLTGYVKGEDVVLANNNDEFVTILKGGVENARIKNARKR